MARDVFISYKREERARVEQIAERLRGLGLDVWFDTKLASGTSFDEEINREVRGAKCVLVCWTPSAMQSDWVRAEASIGKGRDVLAAVFLEPTDLFPPFNLVHTENLADWGGEDLHPGWLGTLARIGELCARPDIVERARRFSASLDVPKPRGKPVTATEKKKVHPAAMGGAFVAIAASLFTILISTGTFDRVLNRGGASGEAALDAPACESTSGIKPEDIRKIIAGTTDLACIETYKSALATSESDAWNLAQIKNTVEAYEAYLQDFPPDATPTPLMVTEAQRRIGILKQNAPPAAPDAIAEAWAKVDRKDADALRAFMQFFPASAQAGEAKTALDALDGAAWERAKGRDNVPAYEAYLAAFGRSKTPQGLYADAAEKRIAELKAAPPPAEPKRPGGLVLTDKVKIAPDVAVKDVIGKVGAARLSGGTATIRQTWTYDFDTKTEGGDGADILFQARTATDRVIVASRGASISGLLPALPSREACSAPKAREIALDAGTTGYFCVRTTGGKIVGVRILEGPGPSPGVLKISFSVWDQ